MLNLWFRYFQTVRLQSVNCLIQALAPELYLVFLLIDAYPAIFLLKKLYPIPLKLIQKFEIKGIAHITGGAFYEKLTKVLPSGKSFLIYREAWSVPKIFQLIQKKGRIIDSEMFRTFNMGIGMALVVAQKDVSRIQAALKKENVQSFEIGQVIKDSKQKIIL